MCECPFCLRSPCIYAMLNEMMYKEDQTGTRDHYLQMWGKCKYMGKQNIDYYVVMF